MQIDFFSEALGPICGQGSVDPGIQVCVLCEAQILAALVPFPKARAAVATAILQGSDDAHTTGTDRAGA
jgi:hypothetical protein